MTTEVLGKQENPYGEHKDMNSHRDIQLLTPSSYMSLSSLHLAVKDPLIQKTPQVSPAVAL